MGDLGGVEGVHGCFSSLGLFLGVEEVVGMAHRIAAAVKAAPDDLAAEEHRVTAAGLADAVWGNRVEGAHQRASPPLVAMWPAAQAAAVKPSAARRMVQMVGSVMRDIGAALRGGCFDDPNLLMLRESGKHDYHAA